MLGTIKGMGEGAGGMAAGFVLIVLFVGLVVLAAGWDLASYTIPNRLTLSIAIAFAGFAFCSRMPLAAVGIHLLAGTGGLVFGIALFALRFVGGGDAKLFAAVSLWFGFPDLLPFALIASIFGGGLTLILLSFRRLPVPAALRGAAWLMRLHDERQGIPYGVALAAGALVVLPHTEILGLVAG